MPPPILGDGRSGATQRLQQWAIDRCSSAGCRRPGISSRSNLDGPLALA